MNIGATLPVEERMETPIVFEVCERHEELEIDGIMKLAVRLRPPGKLYNVIEFKVGKEHHSMFHLGAKFQLTPVVDEVGHGG